MSTIKKIAILALGVLAVSVFYDAIVLKPSNTQNLQASASEATKSKVNKQVVDCASGENPQCRNMCSATYVTVTSRNEVITKDCYYEENNKAKKVIDQLAYCILKKRGNNPNNQALAKQLHDTLKNNLCILKASVKHKSDGGVEIKIQGRSEAIQVPPDCVGYVKEIEKIKSDTSMDNKTAEQACSINGPYVCWGDTITNKYTCLYKKTAAARIKIPGLGGGGTITSPSPGNGPVTPPYSGATTGGGSPFRDSFNSSYNRTSGMFQRTTDMFQQMLMWRMMQSMFGPQQSGPTGPYTHPCDNPYYRVWNKDQCQGPVQVSCLLLPNKTSVAKGEEITLKWEVKNATQHSIIFDVGDDIDKRIISSSATARSKKETVVFKPQKSGQITLKAEGIGTDNTCEQTISITVDGDTGDDTDTDSSLTCSPQIITPGTQTDVTLRFSCPSSSDHALIYKRNSDVFELVGHFDIQQYSTTTVEVSSPTLFKLACMGDNNEIISQSFCSVYTGESVADIIAYPTKVKEGEYARITWGSIGMSTCRVTGPNGFSYEYKNASVLTQPFPPGSTHTTATYTLECASQYGGAYTKDITVTKDQ